VNLLRTIGGPETHVAIFAFLLNLVWEFAQGPLFAGMPTADHWRAILGCGRATLGDAAIALVAFWGVARRWRARGAGCSDQPCVKLSDSLASVP
jgi:hypothetical protein